MEAMQKLRMIDQAVLFLQILPQCRRNRIGYASDANIAIIYILASTDSGEMTDDDFDPFKLWYRRRKAK